MFITTVQVREKRKKPSLDGRERWGSRFFIYMNLIKGERNSSA